MKMTVETNKPSLFQRRSKTTNDVSTCGSPECNIHVTTATEV